VVPELPAEPLGQLRPDDDALPVGREGGPLVVGTRNSGYILLQSSGRIANWEKKFFGSW